MMDAETMGPIPKVIIEPKLPAITARSPPNWSTAVVLRPYKVTIPRIKYNMRITPVHLSFSLNGTL